MIRVARVAESYIVLQLSYADAAYCARFVRRAYTLLALRKDPAVLSLRPTMDALVIETANGFDTDALLRELEALDADKLSEDGGEVLRVPVCYDPELGIDLSALSTITGMPAAEIIGLHAATTFEVWMLGFMPGFPYMGKLPVPLVVARKEKPSPRIPAGSVAVAEEYTGVYPFDSPGGWHVVGRTPWVVTDYKRTPPWLFEYGMKVQFYPITIEEYRQTVSAATES